MGRLNLSAPLSGGGGASQSSFRELDDVFLQTQTRVWLGEVLNMRLDEQIHISDLLADGDLLCEVSKVLWNMLSAKYAELRHLKYKPIGSRKRSGRYMPYSNVDSFLAICKILGMNGIDLFSPSDVVEKRNTRKVCICIRALSKKVRSKQLNVPNFDMVTYAVAMPKDMVGGIRRSLETTKSSISSSSSYNSYNYQRSRVRQRNSTEKVCNRNYDSCSEGSDEAESKYMGEESYCSSTNKFNDTGDTICCPRDDYDLSLGREESIGESTYVNEAEGSYIFDYLAFSDSIIGGNEGDTPVLLDGEDNMLNFFSGNDSFRGRSGQALQDGHEKKIADDIDDVEVSSTASVSSILDRALNLEFDDHFGSLTADTHTVKDAKKQTVISENSSFDQSCVVPVNSFETNQTNGSDDVRILQSSEIPNERDTKDMNENLLAENASEGKDGTIAGLSKDECDTKETDEYLMAENVTDGKDGTIAGLSKDECDTKEMDENLLADDAFNGKDGTIAGLSKNKARKKPLLKTVKTVASGTAVVGLLFLLLHLSRRETGKRGDASRKLVQNNKFKDKEGQSGATAKIYPAEKLKLKN